MTRLERAVQELKEAAGNRPFILVLDRAHRESLQASVAIEVGKKQAGYTSFGLLEAGNFQLKQGEPCFVLPCSRDVTVANDRVLDDDDDEEGDGSLS